MVKNSPLLLECGEEQPSPARIMLTCQSVVQYGEQSPLPEGVAPVYQFVSAALEAAAVAHLT